MTNGQQGYVHSIETMGTVDGPGLRYVVFFNGCPLRCQYCHNPDTQFRKQGTLWSVEDLLADIESYASFLKKGQGGVTFSGGEPLMQPEFLLNLLKGCKAMGLHTAVDTSGALGRRASDEILSYTDLVLLDIKSGLPDVYRDVTGGQLKPTLEFAKRLEQMDKPVWLRFVLVPGLTDGAENVQAVTEIAAGLRNVERVEVLPFHKMGEYKWEKLGLEYKLGDTPAATEPQAEEVRQAFRALDCANVV